MIGYIAKDINGEVYLHTEKPIYDDELGGWYSGPDMINITGQFSEFDNMSYTDEPIKVEIKLEKNMNEYIIAYLTPPNKYGNKYYQAFSKKGAFECFKVENDKSIVLNIIEL